jgi:hypothetical protein
LRVTATGHREIYLHLRFKDGVTAGQLYTRAGFSEAKRDCRLLSLIGQDPRWLMRKQLDPSRPLAGVVNLPGFEGGAAAGAEGAAAGGAAAVSGGAAAAGVCGARPAAAASPAA